MMESDRKIAFAVDEVRLFAHTSVGRPLAFPCVASITGAAVQLAPRHC
jgi:hypothetical protein